MSLPRVHESVAENLATPLPDTRAAELAGESLASAQATAAASEEHLESLARPGVRMAAAAEVLAESLARPGVRKAVAAEAWTENLATPLPDTRADELVSEYLSSPLMAAHSRELIVEVLRRDTAAAAMVSGSIEAFGQAAWPGAQIGVFAFRHDWSESLVERLEWRTEVARLASGNEARAALRQVPRRILRYHVGHGRAIDALVADWLDDHAGRTALWPLPRHAARLTTYAARGAVRLYVDGVDAAAFGPARADPSLGASIGGWGGTPRLALLLADPAWQVVEVAATGATWIDMSEPLPIDAGAGSLLLPLREGITDAAANLVQYVPGLAGGVVTARLSPPAAPTATPGDPVLDDLPVWPEANWADDQEAVSEGAVTIQDWSPADPWVRRDDPWGAGTMGRRWLATGADIERWLARLWSARGRLNPFWLADHLAPVLTVSHTAQPEDSYLRVTGDAVSAWWHRPCGLDIRAPDGSRQYALGATLHADAGGSVLVLALPAENQVPAGSRVIRLARCRLDHDAIDLHWRTDRLLELPLTARRLPEPRGQKNFYYVRG